MTSPSATVAEERFVDVLGGAVYVKRWRPRPRSPSLAETQPTPLVLMHESLGCVGAWRDFPAVLCDRLQRPVVAYDRLGFGKSSARVGLPSQRFISEEAELCFPSVLEALRIEGFFLLGHSVGGSMAVSCAARFPRRCRGIVTESAQAFVEDRTREGVRSARATFSEPANFDRLARHHQDKARWVLDAWTETWLSSTFSSWSLHEELSRTMCPALVLHGDGDEYGSLAHPRAIAQGVRGPATLRIIHGCGHVPHRSHQEEVVAAVEDFFRRYGAESKL